MPPQPSPLPRNLRYRPGLVQGPARTLACWPALTLIFPQMRIAFTLTVCCASRACLGIPHTHRTTEHGHRYNLPEPTRSETWRPPPYNRSLRATIEIKNETRAPDHGSSTLARGHSDAQHRIRRAPRSAYESRHSCCHPLSNSGPGSFALCAQAPVPRPHDILVWKLQ